MSALLSLFGALAIAMGVGGPNELARRFCETRATGTAAVRPNVALGELLYALWLDSRARRRSGRKGLVGLAVHRLPAALDPDEQERWAEEMAADAAAIPGRLRRLRFFVGLWRKGAPGVPVRTSYHPIPDVDRDR
jgi:hypothetical protein